MGILSLNLKPKCYFLSYMSNFTLYAIYVHMLQILKFFQTGLMMRFSSVLVLQSVPYNFQIMNWLSTQK